MNEYITDADGKTSFYHLKDKIARKISSYDISHLLILKMMAVMLFARSFHEFPSKRLRQLFL